jgi:hypothetical protein
LLSNVLAESKCKDVQQNICRMDPRSCSKDYSKFVI